jgi:hypothetical protein
MANRNWLSNKLYQMEAYPVLVSCNFVVDSTNVNGLGIKFLKGGAVKNVYMKTSATPAAGNPNPETGIIMIELQDNYNRLLGGFASAVSPLDGSTQTSTTAGDISVIVSLGTATLAQWQARGLPVGVTPAVGVAFVATTSGSIGGSAAIQGVGVSGAVSLETCGNTNLSLSRPNSIVTGGGLVYLQALDSAGAKVAPANGTVVSVSLYLSNSSVTVQGQ